MSELGGILLMMNNYFHDVATALLLGSGYAIWLMHRETAGKKEGDLAAFRSMYRGMSRLALFAVVWIVLGGIPRTIFYSDYEWSAAAGRGQVAALIVKHVLAFIFLGWGICIWTRMRNILKERSNDQ